MVRTLLQYVATGCLVRFACSCPVKAHEPALQAGDESFDLSCLIQASALSEPASLQLVDDGRKPEREARKLSATKTTRSSSKMSRSSKASGSGSREAKRAKGRAKQRASKLIRRDVAMLLKRAGIPDLFASMLGGFLHNTVMEMRQTSVGRQEFIDHFTEELGNMTEDEITAGSFFKALDEAAEHSHLEEPMQELLTEMESLVMPGGNISSGGPDPAQLFHLLSKGMVQMGMPQEMTEFMEDLSTSFQGDSVQNPSKMFSMLGALYRKMGMPKEVVGMMDEFGAMFLGMFNEINNGKEVQPEKMMGALSGMIKKMGLPDSMLDFCADMAKLMSNSTEPTPEMMMDFLSKAMASMGAPPAMSAGLQDILKAISGEVASPQGFDLTKVLSNMQGSDLQKFLTGMAKIGKQRFASVDGSQGSTALTAGALIEIGTDIQEMIEDEEPLKWSTLTGEVVAPAILRMLITRGRQAVQAARAAGEIQ